ncbi:uncharacterized protein LOC114575787 [Exaiptasia diaphana]|uniref:Uncharacterized protein n=1 Tax=Exaiptasia diaphana TaxID=2652724 RepID=A0A913YPN3_EXADI|nr:uncharacterized protein LOC114575787 [Exaiptasia diaphana]
MLAGAIAGHGRSRRQAVNCTPKEIKQMTSLGINVEKSTIDCSAARTVPVADKHKSSRHKGNHDNAKQNDGHCIPTMVNGKMVDINPYEGQYCCSPICDKYITGVNCPSPAVVSCD